jgi:hypothetical protein
MSTSDPNETPQPSEPERTQGQAVVGKVLDWLWFEFLFGVGPLLARVLLAWYAGRTKELPSFMAPELLFLTLLLSGGTLRELDRATATGWWAIRLKAFKYLLMLIAAGAAVSYGFLMRGNTGEGVTDDTATRIRLGAVASAITVTVMAVVTQVYVALTKEE